MIKFTLLELVHLKFTLLAFFATAICTRLVLTGRGADAKDVGLFVLLFFILDILTHLAQIRS